MERENKLSAAFFARISVVPAAAAFLLLFGINFLFILSALVLVSAGLLCLPLGLLDMTGMVKAVKIVSDFSPAALSAAGAFMLCFGLFLCFFIFLLAPFSVRLFYRYIALFRGESWRRIYSNFTVKKFIVITLVFSLITLGAFVGLRFLDIKRGYRGTVVKESVAFPAANYVYINTTGLNFELKGYDGKDILIEYTNDMPIIVEESNEDYLKISQDDSFCLSLFSKDQFNYKMVIWLPERSYREFYLNSGSGNITLLHTYSRYTKLRTRNGNITVTEAEKEIDAATIKGDIFCSYNSFEFPGSFETGEGNITVTMPQDAAVELRFRTEGGWVDSEFIGLKERFYGSLDMETSPPSAYSKYLYATTGNGSLTLEAAEKKEN